MLASLIAAPAFIQSEFGIAPADAIHCGDECRGIAAITSGAAITAQSVCSLVLGAAQSHIRAGNKLSLCFKTGRSPGNIQ
jgi:hypothetical protein